MHNQVVSRHEWLNARLALLAQEKELTRLSDEVALRRQELPWVRVDKTYRFDTDDGLASLKELFGGRSQLLIYHFMFGPDYKAGCPSCSMIADGFDGFAVHLANHDVALWAASRAPLAKLQEYKRRMGWTFPWASSCGDDFNFDFNVSITEEQQRQGGVEYNYRRGDHPLTAAQVPEPVARFAESCGTDGRTFMRDRPGMSDFAIEDGSSTTPIPPIRVGWTDCGARINGSTARPRGETKRAFGGVATTNTAHPLIHPFSKQEVSNAHSLNRFTTGLGRCP